MMRWEKCRRAVEKKKIDAEGMKIKNKIKGGNSAVLWANVKKKKNYDILVVNSASSYIWDQFTKIIRKNKIK